MLLNILLNKSMQTVQIVMQTLFALRYIYPIR